MKLVKKSLAFVGRCLKALNPFKNKEDDLVVSYPVSPFEGDPYPTSLSLYDALATKPKRVRKSPTKKSVTKKVVTKKPVGKKVAPKTTKRIR